MKNYLLKIILIVIILIHTNLLIGQSVYGLGPDGFSVFDLSNNYYSIINPALSTSLATGQSTSDKINLKYFYIESGFNQNFDTLITIDIITGNIIEKNAIPRASLRNPEYYNGCIYGLSIFGGFEKFDLTSNNYSMLNIDIPYSNVAQGNQSFDTQNEKYLYFVRGDLLTSISDTVITISVNPPYTCDKFIVSDSFLVAPKLHLDYIYGLTLSGFVKLDYISNIYTLLNANYPRDWFTAYPSTINYKSGHYISKRHGNNTDTLLVLSLLDGSFITKEPINKNSIQNPEFFDINLNIISSLSTEIQIYPNPTNGRFSIDIDDFENIEILNSRGLIITDTKNRDIDISYQTAGVYFIRIFTKKETLIIKIIKE